MALGSFLPLAGGLIGGLIGGDEPPGLTPEQRRIWRMFIDRYQSMHRYGNQNPQDDPRFRRDAAQALGQQSEMAGRSRASLFGSQGVTDMANGPAQSRQLSNLAAAEQAQASGLYGNLYGQSLQDRWNVKSQGLPGMLGQMGSLAGSPAGPGQSSGGASLMPFLQQAAYQWGNRPSSQSGGNMVNGQPVDQYGNVTNQSLMGGGGTGTQFRVPISQWQR